MPKSLMELAGSVGSDALALLGIPAATLQTALGQYLADRLNEAGAILLDEVRAGEVDVVTAAGEDDRIGIVYRYMLAARDGAARRNLRLLAKVVVGQAQRDRLFSEDFNRYAKILASLSRDEILVAGRFYVLRQLQLAETTGSREGPDAWSSLKKEMVPNHFSTQDYLEAICAQLAGAGLAIQVTVFGGNAFRPSPILMEVGELADFDTVL